MRVPVGRIVVARELYGKFEVLDRGMKICPAHQRASEGEVRIGRAGARRVTDLIGEGEGIPCESFGALRISVCELDEREVRQCQEGRRAMPRAGECPGLLEWRARLREATVEEECLSQRYEPRVSPFASGRLGLEHEPGLPLGVGDATAEICRADHCDHGANRRDPVGKRAVVGSVLCDAEPSFDFVSSSAAQSCGQRAHCREFAVAEGLRPRERIEPAIERRHSTGREHRYSRTHDERTHARDIPTGNRVVYRVLDVPVVLEPAAKLARASPERSRDRTPLADASIHPRRDGGIDTRSRSRRAGRGRGSSARCRRASRRSRASRARGRKEAQTISRAPTIAP